MSDVDPITGQPVTSPITDVPPSTTPLYTDTAPPVLDPSAGSSTGGSGDAKAKAAEVAGQAKDKASAATGVVGEHASQVTDSAKSHAAEVTTEAKRQASQLLDQGKSQIQTTAGQQTDKVAELLQGFSTQLNAMATGEKPPEGPLADLVQEGAARAEELASRLRTGGYEMALRDVQRFARRRPTAFLATAFGAGLAAGRLFRNTDTSKLTEAVKGGDSGGTPTIESDSGYTPSPSVGSGFTGQGVTNAELELSRGGVPAPLTTGAVTADLAGAPTLGDADPLVSGDPTGLQGGPR